MSFEIDNNLDSAEECQSCSFERVICIQEGRCLLEAEEEYRNRLLRERS